MKTLSKIMFGLLFMSVPYSAYSALLTQEVINGNMYLGGGNLYQNVRAAQSFTAIDTGWLDYIEVNLMASGYSSNSDILFSDLTDASWNVLETTSRNGFSSGMGWYRFDYSDTLLLNVGQEYRFTIRLEGTQNHYGLSASVDDIYAGGTRYVDVDNDTGGYYDASPWDLAFRVNTITSIPEPASLLLLGFGVLGLGLAKRVSR